MTQLDDVQAFANANFPLRPIFYTSDNPNVSYDEDPNAAAAPTILDLSPVGTFYHRTTGDITYWKNGSGFWDIHKGSVRGVVSIFVDPVSGLDTNSGDVSSPVQTLFEASQRTPVYSPSTIELAAGTYVLTDHDTPGLGERTLFSSQVGITVNGTTSVAQTVTITGTVDNVITVSDTLVVDAHIGQYIEYFDPNVREAWIISNTVSTITVAASVGGFGGNRTLPVTGSLDIKQLDSKVVASLVDPFGNTNNFFYSGVFRCNNVDFDGTVNPSLGGARAMSGATTATFNVCKSSGWLSAGVIGGGDMTMLTCFFDSSNAGVSGGRNVLVTNDCLFKGLNTCILNGDSTSEVTIGAQKVHWMLGCTNYVAGRGGKVTDFSVNYYIDPGAMTPTSLIKLSGPTGHYLKENQFLSTVPGHGTITNIIESIAGGHSVDFKDSPSAIVPDITNYIDSNGVTISFADFVAGNPPAVAECLFPDAIGNFYFDTAAAGTPHIASYTVATLPPVGRDRVVVVTDDPNGVVQAYSDGVNWLRSTDGLVVGTVATDSLWIPMRGWEGAQTTITPQLTNLYQVLRMNSYSVDYVSTSFRVPDKWDGVSDLGISLKFIAGTPDLADGETVVWALRWQKATNWLNPNIVTTNQTFTQSGAATLGDFNTVPTHVIDHDEVNNVLSPGDEIAISFDPDSSSTYTLGVLYFWGALMTWNIK